MPINQATSDAPALSVRRLCKSYGSKSVLRGLSFEVRRGEIFGLLGPNGAGKTTTLEIVEGLREASSGDIEILGLTHRKAHKEITARVGVSLQKASLWGRLKVGELVQLYRSFYKAPLPIDTLLEGLDLTAQAGMYLDSLSGGQYQRVVLCVAMVNNPEIVLLDEPTTGLDPDTRRMFWNILRDLREQGKTIILTTHYMEEAQVLSDRVGIIYKGELVCCDTPRQLIHSLRAGTAIVLQHDPRLPLDVVRAMPWCQEARITSQGELIVYSSEIRSGLTGLLELAAGYGIPTDSLNVREPTLEDVFLHYTGCSYSERAQ